MGPVLMSLVSIKPGLLIRGMNDLDCLDCLICIEPCRELSTDLFLYSCECIYPIHPQCFKDWRRRANTDRVCLICQEELDPHSEQPQRQQRLLINPGIDERLDENIKKIYKVIVFCITLAILLIAYLASKHAWQLLQASSW
jgi:hypothetical protein